MASEDFLTHASAGRHATEIHFGLPVAPERHAPKTRFLPAGNFLSRYSFSFLPVGNMMIFHLTFTNHILYDASVMKDVFTVRSAKVGKVIRPSYPAARVRRSTTGKD